MGIETAHSQNILINSSFEIWLDTLGINLPLGWLTSEPNFPGSAVKTNDAHSGNFALKLLANDSIAFATTTSLIRPNDQYDFTGFSKCPSYIGGYFAIAWLTFNGNPIGLPTVIPILLSNRYQSYTQTVTAPDSALFVVVTATALPQATLYVDDVTLTPITQTIKEDYSIIGLDEQILILPNPFKKQTIIQLPYFGRYAPNYTIGIYDIIGRLVKSFFQAKNYIIWDGKDNFGLEVRPGIYFVRIAIEGKSYSQKIVRLKK